MADVTSIVRLLVVLLLIALVVILVTRQLRTPYTLGLVIVGLLLRLVIQEPGISLTPDLVLFVFLPALLFEGSWSTSLSNLRENWFVIFLLAVPGLLLGVILIAIPLHFFAGLMWAEALLLAAVLSPTDPVAVLGLFRQLKVNERLSSIIEGESLFNDGVAGSLYEVFLIIMLASLHHESTTLGGELLEGVGTFVLVAGGGILIGLVVGFLVSRFVSYLDEPLIEVTITLITAYGTYLLADLAGVSGILAVICSGLVLGSYGRAKGMSDRTTEMVDTFWNVIAFLANALLFLLVGIQLNPLHFFEDNQAGPLLFIALLVIISTIIARFIIVLLLPTQIPPFSGVRMRSWRFIIFWSGLRGALSMALILALPPETPLRDELIFATYAIVLFTLLVQGLTIRGFLQHMPGLLQQEAKN
jgi:CPA1 family monovalent cation:H+ antiporter